MILDFTYLKDHYREGSFCVLFLFCFVFWCEVRNQNCKPVLKMIGRLLSSQLEKGLSSSKKPLSMK